MSALFLLSFLLLFNSVSHAEEYIGIVRQSENVNYDQWEREQAEKERQKHKAILDQRQATIDLQRSENLQPAAGLPPGAGVQAVEITQTPQYQQAVMQGRAPAAQSAGGSGQKKKNDEYEDKIDKTAKTLDHNIGLLTNGDQERYTKELDSVYQMQLEAVRAGEGKPVAPEFRKFVEKKMKKVE